MIASFGNLDGAQGGNADQEKWERICRREISAESLIEAADAASSDALEAAWKLPEPLADPNFKGMELTNGKLSDEVLRNVRGHGIQNRRNIREHEEVKILLNILGTGAFQGFSGKLRDDSMHSAWVSSPFVLLSNYGGPLLSAVDGKDRLNLRAVFVNGQYEKLIPRLKEIFPWVTFVTTDTISDELFRTKEPPYRSYLERLEEQV